MPVVYSFLSSNWKDIIARGGNARLCSACRDKKKLEVFPFISQPLDQKIAYVGNRIVRTIIILYECIFRRVWHTLRSSYVYINIIWVVGTYTHYILLLCPFVVVVFDSSGVFQRLHVCQPFPRLLRDGISTESCASRHHLNV